MIIKPSELIHQALEALEWFESKDNTQVHMGVWVTVSGFSNRKSPCLACLGGAWLLKQSGIEDFSDSSHAVFRSVDYRSRNAKQSECESALDYLRVGDVNTALIHLCSDGIRLREYAQQFEITDYDEDPKKFKKDMAAMAAKLQEEGL